MRGGADAAPEPATRPRERSRGPLWLLGALIALLLGAALLQTERLDRMSEQADGLRSANAALQAGLADAQARIQGYEQQRAQLRGSVDDLAQRVAALQDLVRADAGPQDAVPAPAAEPVPADPAAAASEPDPAL